MKNEQKSLALQYHENSKSLAQTYDFDPQVSYKVYPGAEFIKFNAPTYPCSQVNVSIKCEDSFLKSMMERKSTRDFTSEPIGLDTLSRLITLSCGHNNAQKGEKYRTYPSAGARYPIEVYVIILRSNEIEKGIYHYNVLDNGLEYVKTCESADNAKKFYSNQADIINGIYPCLILFSAVFKRTMEKYGERGYRFLFLDAGHMAQNLYLTATYLGLGIVALGVGSGNDNKLDDILGLVSSEENVIYGFAVGYPKKHKDVNLTH